MAYPHPRVVVWVGLTVCLLASGYVYLLRRPDFDRLYVPARQAGKALDAAELAAQDRNDRALRWPFGYVVGYWRFATNILGVVTIVAGLIGASAAFTAQYLTSPDWSGSMADWFTYVGAVSSAFVAASTAGRLAQNTYWARGED